MPVSSNRNRMQYALTCLVIGQLAAMASREMNEVSNTRGKLIPSVPMKYWMSKEGIHS